MRLAYELQNLLDKWLDDEASILLFEMLRTIFDLLDHNFLIKKMRKICLGARWNSLKKLGILE